MVANLDCKHCIPDPRSRPTRIDESLTQTPLTCALGRWDGYEELPADGMLCGGCPDYEPGEADRDFFGEALGAVGSPDEPEEGPGTDYADPEAMALAWKRARLKVGAHKVLGALVLLLGVGGLVLAVLFAEEGVVYMAALSVGMILVGIWTLSRRVEAEVAQHLVRCPRCGKRVRVANLDDGFLFPGVLGLARLLLTGRLRTFHDQLECTACDWRGDIPAQAPEDADESDG